MPDIYGNPLDDEEIDGLPPAAHLPPTGGLNPMVAKYLSGMNTGSVNPQIAQNNYLGNVAASAAMMGSVGGGHVASAAPLQQQLAGDNADIEKGEDRSQKLGQYLSGLQQKKEMVDNARSDKKEMQSNMLDLKRDSLDWQKQHGKDMATIASSNKEKKDDKGVNDRFIAMNKALDETGSTKGPMAKEVEKTFARDRILKLIGSKTDPDDLSKINVQELGESVGQLTSGGVGTSEGRVNALVPKSIWGDASAITSYITNTYQGANLGNFVLQMKDLAEREGQVSDEHIRDSKLNRVLNDPSLKKEDPERFNKYIAHHLGKHGITPDDFDEKGYYKERGPQTTQAPVVQQGGGDGTAMAAGGGNQQPQISADQTRQTMNVPKSENQKAMDWIAKNPTDPRSSAVRQKLIKENILKLRDKVQ